VKDGVIIFVKKPVRFGHGRLAFPVPAELKEKLMADKQYIVIAIPLRSVLESARL